MAYNWLSAYEVPPKAEFERGVKFVAIYALLYEVGGVIIIYLMPISRIIHFIIN
jgi:hypothetical protein